MQEWLIQESILLLFDSNHMQSWYQNDLIIHSPSANAISESVSGRQVKVSFYKNIYKSSYIYSLENFWKGKPMTFENSIIDKPKFLNIFLPRQ